MHQPIDKSDLCRRAYIAGYHEARMAEEDGRDVEVPVLIVQAIAEAFADGVMHYCMARVMGTGRLVAYYGNA